MTTVAASDAQQMLPQLLARVARGEEILISEGGKSVAKLIPPPREDADDVRSIVEAFKAYSSRQKRTLGENSFRDLIEEGRRF